MHLLRQQSPVKELQKKVQECPGAEHDATGGIRVVEFEGEPSWEGWKAAPTETMIDRFYRFTSC